MAAYYCDHNLLQKMKRCWIPFCNKVMKFRNDKLIHIYSDLLRERDDDFSETMVLFEVMMTVRASTATCEHGQIKGKYLDQSGSLVA